MTKKLKFGFKTLKFYLKSLESLKSHLKTLEKDLIQIRPKIWPEIHEPDF